MQKLLSRWWLGAVISGLLTFVAVCQLNFMMSWICYVPLFTYIYNKPAGKAFKSGFVLGFTYSCFAFFWMIPGAERFTGYNMLYGLGVFVISAVFYSFFCAAVLYCFALVKKKDHTVRSITINSTLAAALFCTAEALLRIVSTGFPWFDFHSGNGLAENLYTIQPASIFGIHIMTFVVVVINYQLALMALKRTWKTLYIPAAIVVAYLLSGVFLLQNFNNNLRVSQPLNVAILAENISPDITWDDNSGDSLVKKLLDLNRIAIGLKPDMALWSESAIPWTYRKDDDLVKEILKITDPANITHIMGINTAHKDDEVFNSAYCILPGGNVTGRYDKQYLLTFIERPLNGWLMPFFSSKGYSAISDTQHNEPLTTRYGKAGLLICNESALPAAAANQVKKGAAFLLNMSNDGWFNDTYIVKAHYYYARLRAVECRKDIAINCNNGFSGLINAAGNIKAKQKSSEPFVKMVTIEPNAYITTATMYPLIFVYGCAIYLAIIILSTYINKQNKKR